MSGFFILIRLELAQRRNGIKKTLPNEMRSGFAWLTVYPKRDHGSNPFTKVCLREDGIKKIRAESPPAIRAGNEVGFACLTVYPKRDHGSNHLYQRLQSAAREYSKTLSEINSNLEDKY